MMSALNDKGQLPKKKLISYGKAVTRTRNPPATLSASSSRVSEPSQSSQSSTSAPVKDIYDFDFVDDPPPVRKPAARPRPSPTARASTKPQTATSTTTSTLAAALTAKRTAVAQRPSAIRSTTDAARGTKRKPPQIEPPVRQQTSNAAGAGAADCGTFTQGAQATQRAKASRPITTPIAEPGPNLPRSISAVVQTAVKPVLLRSSSAAPPPAGQRVPKTPPRDMEISRAAAGTRAPSASPGKARGVATASRSRQPVEAVLGMPFRPQDKPKPQLQSQAHSQPTHRKRRRLIDALAAQKEEEEGQDEDDPRDEEAVEDDGSSQSSIIASRYRHRQSTPGSDGRATMMDLDSLMTASPGRLSVAPSTPGTIARRPTTRRKFTYNVQRTILAEQPPSLDGPSGSDLSVLQSLLPEPESQASAYDLDDEAGGSQGAIQSIHELRQAGANSRFSDELVDIMDRINLKTGKPSSSRRSALMEMAEKLQDRSFMRHFRDHGSEAQLFRDVGKESDMIAGFVLSCIVVTLLTSGNVSNRLLRDLQLQKVDVLFGMLIRADEDILKLAKDRKNNVSGFSRQVLGKLKEAVRKLPIWKPVPAAPLDMSPRTIALLSLHLFVQQLHSGGGSGFGENDAILSAALTKQLFDIVSSMLPSAYDAMEEAGEETSPSLLSCGITSDVEAVDLYLALSLLERHSVAAMQLDIGAEWTRHYIPILAESLALSLEGHQQQERQLNGLELLTLKLAMNTANNNPEAARYYVEKGLLRKLAEQSSRALSEIVLSVKAGSDVMPGALDELLLMLGVMINFSENDESAAKSLVEDGGSALIERLGTCFLDGRSISAEADSEEKTQINVAFAYLSILLGYLCRYEPVYQAFKRLSPGGSPKPLLDSIHQFIDFHDQVRKTSDADYSAEAGHFTARLQALARELEVRAY